MISAERCKHNVEVSAVHRLAIHSSLIELQAPFLSVVQKQNESVSRDIQLRRYSIQALQSPIADGRQFLDVRHLLLEEMGERD